jgi:hypothetical protein
VSLVHRFISFFIEFRASCTALFLSFFSDAKG